MTSFDRLDYLLHLKNIIYFKNKLRNLLKLLNFFDTDCDYIFFLICHISNRILNCKRVSRLFKNFLGRRPPTTSHKDEVPSEEGENTNPNVQHSEEQPVYSSVKPRLREWEKHKAPWLEEMKKNQVKRTLISALEENSSEIESNLKVSMANFFFFNRNTRSPKFCIEIVF